MIEMILHAELATDQFGDAASGPDITSKAERFVSRVIPDTKAVVRTRPLEALIIGGYVRR